MGHTRIAFLIWLVGTWFLLTEPAYACTCMAPATAAEALQSLRPFSGAGESHETHPSWTASVSRILPVTGSSLRSQNSVKALHRRASSSSPGSPERPVDSPLRKRRDTWCT